MAKADRDAVFRARKRVPPPGGALLEDTEKMKQKHHRMLCAFCALVILVSTVFPTAAFAEQPVDAAAAEQTLTRADAAEMQQADSMQLKRIYDRVLELCPVRIKLEGESRRTQNAQQRLAVANDLLKPSART